jgi:hypothetical protein
MLLCPVVACSANTRVLEVGSDGSTADVNADAGADAMPRDSGPLPLDAGMSCEAGMTDAGCPKPCGSITLRGKEIITYVTDSGDVAVPSDLTGRMIAVLIYDEAQRCFATYPAVATATGTFQVDGLPPATYYVRTSAQNDYVITASTSIDLSDRQLGRWDAVRAGPHTALTLNVTGLDPWQYGDGLLLYSSNADILTDFPIAPANGSTALSLYRWPFYSFLNLIDATRGDRALLVQFLTRSTQNGLSYQAVGKIANLPPFTMMNGRTTTVAGAFVEVPQDLSTTISVDLGAFVRQLMASSLVSLDNVISIWARPEARESYSYGAPLVSTYLSVAQNVVATFRYGNPFRPRYGRAYFIDAFGSFNYPAGGMLGYGSGLAGLVVSDQIVAEPIVGPVEGMTINGHSTQQAIMGVSATPLIAWTAPQLGAQPGYQMTIMKHAPQRAYFGDVVGSITTSNTSFVLPPGILEPNEIYVFDVNAIARMPNMQGYAEYLTSQISL